MRFMTFNEGKNQVEYAYERIYETSLLVNQAISEAFLYTWQWWLGMGLFIIPWLVWFMFRRKESTGRLLVAGLISILIGIIVDMFAISMGKWSYPMKFIPNSLFILLPYHFSLLPVGVMFTIQIMLKVNYILKGSIFAGLGAFIVMPLFAIGGFYNSKGWPSIYDFFILLSVYLVAYWLSNMNSFEKIRPGDGENYKYSFNLLRRKQKAR